MNNIYKLNKLSDGNKSDWLEKANWRKQNKKWLDISANIALNIISTMDSKNISKEELAKELNISIKKLNSILSGNFNFDINTISIIETKLKIKLI
ncbi:MAG: hypothetical protein M0R46_16500 [Candidatus Muirbacterium halophilum]|nr:hypothetical protein [Candidatus Muirbacterium halophilum]